MQTASTYRRLQRFFQHVRLGEDWALPLLIGVLGHHQLSRVSPRTAAEIVARYKGLADIGRGFRALKSNIKRAPVHHRLPAIICFQALVLYRVMRMRLKAKASVQIHALPWIFLGAFSRRLRALALQPIQPSHGSNWTSSTH